MAQEPGRSHRAPASRYTQSAEPVIREHPPAFSHPTIRRRRRNRRREGKTKKPPCCEVCGRPALCLQRPPAPHRHPSALFSKPAPRAAARIRLSAGAWDRPPALQAGARRPCFRSSTRPSWPRRPPQRSSLLPFQKEREKKGGRGRFPPPMTTSVLESERRQMGNPPAAERPAVLAAPRAHHRSAPPPLRRARSGNHRCEVPDPQVRPP